MYNSNNKLFDPKEIVVDVIRCGKGTYSILIVGSIIADVGPMIIFNELKDKQYHEGMNIKVN